MKFRHKKIKREHSIIDGALDWLEDLSKNREVTDIIPGVIDITHTKERGAFFQYETTSGCKLLVKNSGAIQEVFVVTPNPQHVQDWVAKIMAELDLMQSALDQKPPFAKERSEQKSHQKKEKTFKSSKPSPGKQKGGSSAQPERELSKRDDLLIGTKEDYQLVEINKGLRDSFVDSLASMADLDDPKLEDILDSNIREALKKYTKGKQSKKD